MKVGITQHFKSMVTAAGNTLARPINKKYIVEVGFRSLPDEEMMRLQKHIGKLTVSISFLEPATNTLKTVNCLLATSLVEYYTIQDTEIRYKPFSLQFAQL